MSLLWLARGRIEAAGAQELKELAKAHDGVFLHALANVRVQIANACRALGDEGAAQMELDAARWVFERQTWESAQ
jgi:hypothetical protein